MKIYEAWEELKEWATDFVGGPFGEVLYAKMEELENKYE
jgi:hypothetical protein